MPVGSITLNASTGAATPLRAGVPRLRQTKNPSINRYVAALITSVPGSARVCRRAAMFGVSPEIAIGSGLVVPPNCPTTAETGMRRDAHLQRLHQTLVHLGNCCNNLKTGSDRALGIIFMRKGVAEVD